MGCGCGGSNAWSPEANAAIQADRATLQSVKNGKVRGGPTQPGYYDTGQPPVLTDAK